MDDIYIGSLSIETRRALSDYLLSIDRDDLSDKTYWDFNEFCGLWFRLNAAIDTPRLFPKGKYATLQQMQFMIEEAIRKDCETV